MRHVLVVATIVLGCHPATGPVIGAGGGPPGGPTIHRAINDNEVAIAYDNALATLAVMDRPDPSSTPPIESLVRKRNQAEAGLARTREGLEAAARPGALDNNAAYEVFADARGATKYDLKGPTTCSPSDCKYGELTAAQLKAKLGELRDRLAQVSKDTHDQIAAAIRQKHPNATPAQIDAAALYGEPRVTGTAKKLRKDGYAPPSNAAECWGFETQWICWGADGSVVASPTTMVAARPGSGPPSGDARPGDSSCIDVEIKDVVGCTVEKWNGSGWETAMPLCAPPGTKFQVCSTTQHTCKTYRARGSKLTLGDC